MEYREFVLQLPEGARDTELSRFYEARIEEWVDSKLAEIAEINLKNGLPPGEYTSEQQSQIYFYNNIRIEYMPDSEYYAGT